MPAEDLRKIEENASRPIPRKPMVKRVNKAQAKTGEIQCMENGLSSSAMDSAKKANESLLQRANLLKAGGAAYAEAAIALEMNATQIFLQAAEQRYRELKQQQTQPQASTVDGWVYDSTLQIDFNQTLEQCLTVGNEKPQLVGE